MPGLLLNRIKFQSCYQVLSSQNCKPVYICLSHCNGQSFTSMENSKEVKPICVIAFFAQLHGYRCDLYRKAFYTSQMPNNRCVSCTQKSRYTIWCSAPTWSLRKGQFILWHNVCYTSHTNTRHQSMVLRSRQGTPSGNLQPYRRILLVKMENFFFLNNEGLEGPGAVLKPRGYRPDYIKGLWKTQNNREALILCKQDPR
jgi:hypothetical protein